MPSIAPPRHLDLDDNYEETVAFLKKVRIASEEFDERLHIDFKEIDQISPAAALLVVAECDRWRTRTRKQSLRVINVQEWNPTVFRRLREMGFFEILRARGRFPPATDLGEERFVPFRSGNRSPGEPAKELRRSIEELGPRIADRHALYDGLVEAMTNVHHHAYKEGNPLLHRWWISASVNVAANTMTVMVVDHGQGIARTLPASQMWRFIEAVAGGALDFLKSDSKIVEAAFDIGAGNKSQTGEVHRGKGLRENIRGYVDAHNSSGELLVVTNKAKYRYYKQGSDERTSASELETPFDGTFIQWTIQDYGNDEPNHD